jgi:hypothetical protein
MILNSFVWVHYQFFLFYIQLVEVYLIYYYVSNDELLLVLLPNFITYDIELCVCIMHSLSSLWLPWEVSASVVEVEWVHIWIFCGGKSNIYDILCSWGQSGQIKFDILCVICLKNYVYAN